MNSSLKKFGLALVVLVTCVFLYESGKKKPIHWYESYSNRDKNPYGLYIFDQEVQRLLGQDSLLRFDSSIYDFLSDQLYDTLHPSNLIILADRSGDLDEYTADYLKAYVEEGNTAIILQGSFNNMFLEVFGLEEDYIYSSVRADSQANTILELTNEQLTKQKFTVRNVDYSNEFMIVDSLKNNIDILGYKTIQDTIKQVNLVRVRQGKGELLLGLDPIILTNYYLLSSNNHLYAEGLFSYLPNQKTYLYGQEASQKQESRSLLRFIFANTALRWAWYFFLLTLLVFTLFTAKRRQRIIPIIKPVKNTTIQFTKTVANLYIQSKDYSDLMHKSIIYTLEKIRRKYYIETTNLDENFVHYYHLKSNKNQQDILAYVQFVNQFRQQQHPATEADLVQLNRLTEKIVD
ncbi:DUF4350 domain-containing protein [Myroides sp. WP-1]|uniref:DUF4350 domain-containing protein n=1 Tax=Myroides sp. WP-1 TaxID=2759944 RepID=UPI0015FDBBA3|nr:DUF4350 domain-containing protein [Myroides sp. WP-1]MBB1140915.1 hypothetical protein [Myroides sp. WP-1]